ncbi:hypothetical protein EON81_02190 [bacterium]|nr:MAG: hypothetical protein EON81_02190 [bacterium]
MLFNRHFNAGECLYRDVAGRRVLADVEGAGVWAVTGLDSVVPFVDGLASGERSGLFQRSFRLISDGDGQVEVEVESPAKRTPGNLVGVSLPYRGSGWLAKAEGEVYGDGSPDSLSIGSPFFLELSGSGEVEIEEASGRWTALSSDIPLKGLSRPHPVNGCRSVLNELTLDINVPFEAPIRLLRTYDRFHGRQRARIFLNGEPIGWWRDAVEDRILRIATSSFGFFAPAGPVRITVLPQPGSALWSFREIAVLIYEG